jgi:drug/metabolite transporter (DMT)-like permease
MFIFETPTIENIIKGIGPILYLGIMSSGVAYTLQIIGQQQCENSTVSSIAMSFESVFAAVGGAIFGDIMTKKEIIGCVIMFCAIIISQLPTKKLNKN